MKKHLFKPGFEFIFSLSVLAILGLPPLVFGQSHNDMQITINNTDTTVNGKNIKDLSTTERKDAMKDIHQLANIDENGGKENIKHVVILDKARKGDSVGHKELFFAQGNNIAHFRMHKGKGMDSIGSFNGEPNRKMAMREYRFNRDDDRGAMSFERRNSQNFEYATTDNNGISTRVSYRVTDHHGPLTVDANPKGDGQLEMLDLRDLNIVPEFSAGKTVLMFTLPAKTTAEVKLKDEKGTLIWSEKAINGSFNKSFPLGLNGIYYLQVKQAGKIAMKRIVKE